MASADVVVPSGGATDIVVEKSVMSAAGARTGQPSPPPVVMSSTSTATKEEPVVVMEGAKPAAGISTNGHDLTVSSPEKGAMSEELKDIFNKLIDNQGHLDMRNVTTMIWVNRKRPDIVETIVELLIENSNERRVFNGIEFYLPQLAHMIIHLDVNLPSSALEQFALVVCQQSLHVALQLNWILVAALEDYHAELPDGSHNKKANTTYFNRCAKLLQNVERIIALGAPSAAELEELYATGQLSRNEVETRRLAERKKQAEKVISSPKEGIVAESDNLRVKGWLWHKRWHKRGFPHKSSWLRRWFEVEDRVLYCYKDQGESKEGSRIKRAAVLYQASVVVCNYKDGKYPHYFEVHSPMGNMRLRADDEAGKEAWVSSLQKQAKAMPSVEHFYSHSHSHSQQQVTGSSSQVTKARPSITIAEERDSGHGSQQNGGSGKESSGEVLVRSAIASATREDEHEDVGASAAAVDVAVKELLASTAETRRSVMHMGNIVQMEAKRNKRFRFFNDERKFVSDLTDICEALRFVEDRSKRSSVLESLLMGVDIPECVYLPLCKSTEPFQRVLKITANEAKAFSTKERVPVMVTFETERTWPPRSDGVDSPPLDVASFLHFVYGSYAPMHLHQQRYSMTALRGGEESFMDPDLLAVGEGREADDATPTMRHNRSGSFLFRAGSKGKTFQMPPMQLTGHFASVWRDKPADSSKTKEARGAKSPFRHNLHSLSSALSARASSIRHVKLPGVLHGVSKRSSSINTPGSTMGSVSSAAPVNENGQPLNAAVIFGEEEKTGDPLRQASMATTDVSIVVPSGGAGADSEVPAPGSHMSAKSVAWKDVGEAETKVTLPNGMKSSPRQVSRETVEVTAVKPAFTVNGESKISGQEEKKEGGLEEAAGKHGKRDSTVVLEDASAVDRALETTGGGIPEAGGISASGLDVQFFASGSELLDVPLENDDISEPTPPAGEKGPSEGEKKSSKAYGESMAVKAQRIRRQSTEGTRVGWTLQRLIVKSNDDVRQEVFVMQLIIFYKEVFEREGLELFLKPYSILSTAKTTGMIEFLNQATSMDGLKKSDGYRGSLLAHFYSEYGPAESDSFKAAQRRFMVSLAGYSVVSYLLRIKDRHNGNVMIDSEGHVVHIDFGFVLGSAPGNKFSMERAAFKMTAEYRALLGGRGSTLYEEFVDLFTKGIMAARKYATVTITMIEIMMFQSEFPCFEYSGESALTGFKKRLFLGMKDSDVIKRCRRMVEHADGHGGTRFYDKFQLWTNGIAP